MKKIVICALPLFAAACTAVGPDYHASELNLPATYRQQNEAPLSVSDQWWRALNDAQLSALIGLALENNTDIQMATARLRQSRAVQAIQGAGDDPVVNADSRISKDLLSLNSENFANVPFKNPKNDFTNRQLGFDASWEIDLWGHQQRINEGAQARTEASQVRLADVRLQVSAEVSRVYLDYLTARQRHRIAEENAQNYDASLRLVQLQAKHGEATALDVQRAQIGRDNYVSGIPSLAQAASQSLASLSILTGIPASGLEQRLTPAVSVTAISLPSPPASGIPADVLRHRPDVYASERDLAAASADVGVATADLYPRFSLVGSAGWNSIQSGNLLSSASQTWSIGPQLSLPLLNGKRLQNQVKANQAAFDASYAAYRKSVLNAVADVETSISRLSNSEQARARIQAALEQQLAQSRLTEKQWKSGEVTRLNVLEARKSVAMQEDALVQAQAQSLTAFISLNKALGGGWDADKKEK